MAKSMKKLTRIRHSGDQFLRQSASGAAEMRRIHEKLLAAGFEHDGMDGYTKLETGDVNANS